MRSENFRNRYFASLEAVLQHFVGNDTVRRAAIAVAGPITGDRVALLNIDWQFSQKAFAEALGFERLIVLNDFEALAHALPVLGESDCHRVGGGDFEAGMPKAVVGPGSGLGVGSIVPAGDDWIAIGGEGGHVTLAPQTDTEARVIDDYRDESGHCSAEKLLSGPGLTRIHSSLARHRGSEGPELAPDAITAARAAGDALAVASCELFFALLGAVAGNLALTLGARGGVYIGGGIVPRMTDAIDTSAFRERFVGKGRYRGYLEKIATPVIMTDTPAFLGLRRVLAARN